MTATAQVKQHLARIPAGKPFLAASLREFASSDNLRQMLNRMVKAGELTRVARGVYVIPKHVGKMGEVLPSPSEVAETLASQIGETIAVQGAEAARQLQLTTQVPLKLIFYTNGNTRTFSIANRTVKLKHVNPSVLIEAGTVPGLVISALRYLGKEHVTLKTIEKIKQQVSSKDFELTIKLMERMPAWMSNIFYLFQREHKSKK